MKKLFLLSLSASLIVGSYAQTNIRANQIVADDKFFPPVKDTTQTPGRVGQLTVRAADTSLYIAISITAPKKWQKILKLTDVSGGGGGGFSSVGTIDGGTNDAKGINAAGGVLYGQSADGVNPGFMTVAQYKRIFSLQTSANPTGTITHNQNSGGQHKITFTATGGRTLAFSNLVSGDITLLQFDNTSGANVTLTLPSNSFVNYTSAATTTIAQGKSTLSLAHFDGTNYWFNQSGVELSLTTIGTTGGATYDPITGVLNIPDYSASPYVAGSNKQFQFNNAGALAGSSMLTQETNQIKVSGGAAATKTMVVVAAASQTATTFETQNSSGNPIFIATENGIQILNSNSGFGPVNPIAGGSLEISFINGGTNAGFIQSYNRGGGTYQPVSLLGDPVNLGTYGGTKANMNSVGRMFFGGSTSATANVHIKAGTATASTAPLKVDPGTNLTTPEDGAVEYDGAHFYATIGSTRYQLDQQSGTTSMAAHSYTATLTNTTNISSSTLYQATYIRMDSIVEVQITGQLTPTAGAGTNSELRFTLPITTSSATNQAWVVTGNFIGAGVLGNQVTGIGGLVSTTVGQFFFQSNSTSASSTFQIKFQYKL